AVSRRILEESVTRRRATRIGLSQHGPESSGSHYSIVKDDERSRTTARLLHDFSIDCTIQQVYRELQVVFFASAHRRDGLPQRRARRP
ncbi:hypothetical protein, partial [Novosphingobium sp.]|uniref:hypothetical protein n=1 Tax=Novosphingobium sp. TaxID=1874826 RepID=UPI0028B229C1